jgi:hypothetical protein
MKGEGKKGKKDNGGTKSEGQGTKGEGEGRGRRARAKGEGKRAKRTNEGTKDEGRYKERIRGVEFNYEGDL